LLSNANTTHLHDYYKLELLRTKYPNKVNKITRLWQELKRRNVVRRNAVYAGAAFVILELVSIVEKPLNLPERTMPLVIILLIIGLLASVIVSWIYEVSPEGILERTKPINEADSNETTSTSSTWKIASYISFVVIIALIVLNIFQPSNQPEEATNLDVSIAVLPFQNLSNDSTQVYFCEAMREEILNHLEKVKVFSVRSRTSTDHYRNTTKSSILIGQELKVNYLVEGSVSLIGNDTKIWLQLINARNDEHIWSGDFIREKKQIFELQTEIAQTLAAELKTTLSPKEIEDIAAKPTENTEAYHAYMRGRYYTNQPHDDQEHWRQALKSFKESVELDSTLL
jgi:TolB-like protein